MTDVNGRPSPSTRATRAGLGHGSAEAGAALVPSPSLAAVRTYSDLATLDAAMETWEAYRRYGSESTKLLESALADLETPDHGAPPLARVTTSGQAALAVALMLLAGPRRRRVVVVRPCYGGTDSLIAGPLGNLGLDLTPVDTIAGENDHAAKVAAVLDDDVCAVVTEVITNPLMTLIDVPAIIEAAHAAGTVCVVDSTFTSPFFFQPMAYGADAVFHSLTKHLSGHSDVLGGVLLVRADLDAAGWTDGFANLLGAELSPFDAWLALRGLRTAALRLERGSQSAAQLASWFSRDGRVHGVHYPGLHGDDEATRAERLLPRGRGPMLSVELEGGVEAVDAFVQRLTGVRLAPSLGDVATTISHPALTSHRALSPERRRALGISDGLIRISTGVETVEDLQSEFDRALG
ncbi:MAG: PLP-dependent transferase [Candidatus Dormibacteraeota bacterium]|nr:PLP-dependent transferase [Candidatus Dormibacteraeota bacterium]